MSDLKGTNAVHSRLRKFYFRAGCVDSNCSGEVQLTAVRDFGTSREEVLAELPSWKLDAIRCAMVIICCFQTQLNHTKVNHLFFNAKPATGRVGYCSIVCRLIEASTSLNVPSPLSMLA